MTVSASALRILSFAAAGYALVPSAGAAQDVPPVSTGSDSVTVGQLTDPFSGVQQINAAAGSRNQQLNLGLIAMGDVAIATASAAQVSSNPVLAEDRTASATIPDGAFAGSHGLTAVNAVAGSDNQQANMALVAIGLEGPVIADAVLMQTRASYQPSEEQGAAAPESSVTMGQGAFANSSGIIQVSLIGGARNSSANLAVLTVQAGND